MSTQRNTTMPTTPVRGSCVGDTCPAGGSEPWTGGAALPSLPPVHGDVADFVMRNALLPPPPRMPRELSFKWRKRLALAWCAVSCGLTIAYTAEHWTIAASFPAACVSIAGLLVCSALLSGGRL